MTRVAEWVGAGVLAAGVSAALLAGAGAANADTDTGPDTGPSSTSATDDGSDDAAEGNDSAEGLGSAKAKDDSAKTKEERQEERTEKPEEKTGKDRQQDAEQSEAPSQDEPESETEPQPEPEPEPQPEPDNKADDKTPGELEAPTSDDTASDDTASDDTAADDTAADDTAADDTAAEITDVTPAVRTTATSHAAQVDTADTPPATQAQPVPIVGDIIGPFQPDYPPLIRAIGSAVFNLIGAIVQTADGPPVVPPELRDSVHVSSSTLVVSPGNELAADWYYPTHGQPTRMIYLQHGILASSPMYSYTAAYLAERTNSIVVATTITSNPFAEGGLWLGGDNMHKAVAQLFLDEDRTALNASLTTATLNAGGPNLTVPTEFVIVGHSLGGGFAPGVAGHYAEGLVARRADGADAPNELAGLVLLDAVPFTPILPNAMDRLKLLENSNNGDPADYVAVYEIGAPWNFLNSFSSVNEELSDARPGKFNGVVINGGVHMDGMLGGNPLIQAAAYLVAGIPQPQNPPAVQLLMAGWINDMFTDSIDPTTGRCLGEDCEGIYGDPGDTIVIPSGTEHGDGSAVVIDSGSLPAVTQLRQGTFVPVRIAV